MNTVLEPILKDAVTRYTKFNKPEPRDAVRILGPALEAICLDAKAPAERAAEWLQSENAETITAESVRDFVRSVTEAPAHVRAAALARQSQIEREIAATPLPPDTEELSQPIGERSRAALEARIAKLRRHFDIKACATEQIQLEDELDKRDCAIEGI